MFTVGPSFALRCSTVVTVAAALVFYMSRRLSSRSIAARVVSDINRSFDELVNELSCIGSAIGVINRCDG